MIGKPTRAQLKAGTRQRVVEAADRVFQAVGYEKATMRDIAKETGTSTGAIFASFSDKAALYAEIFGHPPVSPEQGRALYHALASLTRHSPTDAQLNVAYNALDDVSPNIWRSF